MTEPPGWLDSFAASYQLDTERLRNWLERRDSPEAGNVWPELLAHWTLIGNTDSMLLARKGEAPWRALSEAQRREPESCRRWDPILLACARDGFLPVHGVYPPEGAGAERYCWLQPEAALLVSGSAEVEMTVTCPAPDFLAHPVRFELAWEEDEVPTLVVLLRPGKTVRLRVPGPSSASGSRLLRLRTSASFRPSNRQPGNQDTRELAVQLRGVQASTL